ncbi:MAG: putative toxin-antitoxin system toxin component, PIN family [Betaproteobacteria bacterium]|nr:putative toxin-antitoxin system toxin component, PIN family [Betaproteobacteria bacterium]
MRLVLDTNIVISGLLWNGPPRRLLDAAISGTVDIYTSAVLITELREALAYPKFARRITANADSVDRCIGRFMAIANLTAAATIEGTVSADPDDDHVIACALSAQADVIVSGDAHLLDLKSFHRMPIITATDALARIGKANPDT